LNHPWRNGSSTTPHTTVNWQCNGGRCCQQ
jgi:hypothetical protein